MSKKPYIWVDADASPRAIKEIVFKVSHRLRIPVRLVANQYLNTPASKLIQAVVVPKGQDMADSWIVTHVRPRDIVITADIPLAADIVEKGAHGISPRGEEFTEDNVRSRLSVRDFMTELREQGVEHGGPPPFGAKDKQRFASALDRLVSRRMREYEQERAAATDK